MANVITFFGWNRKKLFLNVSWLKSDNFNLRSQHSLWSQYDSNGAIAAQIWSALSLYLLSLKITCIAFNGMCLEAVKTGKISYKWISLIKRIESKQKEVLQGPKIGPIWPENVILSQNFQRFICCFNIVCWWVLKFRG